MTIIGTANIHPLNRTPSKIIETHQIEIQFSKKH
jgi:hypothetical protein